MNDELPPLSDSRLDGETLVALFEDLARFAIVEEIILKSRPGYADVTPRTTLDEARRLLLDGSVSGVQIRYRHGDARWCDTLMAADEGVRLVRMRISPANGADHAPG